MSLAAKEHTALAQLFSDADAARQLMAAASPRVQAAAGASDEAEAVHLLWALIVRHRRASASNGRSARGAHPSVPRSVEDAQALGEAEGAFASRIADHPLCGSACTWQSLERRQPFVDPRPGGLRAQASGRVYVCTYSGRVHVCTGESECVPYLRAVHGSYVCAVSGETRGQVISVAAPDADRATLRQAQDLTVGPSRAALATRPPPGRFGRPGVLGKRTRAAAGPPAPPQRYAPGSAADKFANAVDAEGAPLFRAAAGAGPDACYGEALVRFAVASVSETSRGDARAWCSLLLFDPQTMGIHAQLRHESTRRLEARLQAIVPMYQRWPGYCTAYAIQQAYAHHRPHLDRIMWLKCATDAVRRQVVDYCAAAVMHVWKAIECTPNCCKLGQYDGGPTSKRHRASVQLRNFAVAIMYMLLDGHVMPFWYDADTRLVLPEQTGADLAARQVPNSRGDGPRAVKARIEFVPAHPWLAVLLLEQNLVRLLDFDAVLVRRGQSARSPQGQAAHAESSRFKERIVTITGQISQAFRSLCDGARLSVDQLEQYRLARYLTVMDFGPVPAVVLTRPETLAPTVGPARPGA